MFRIIYQTDDDSTPSIAYRPGDNISLVRKRFEEERPDVQVKDIHDRDAKDSCSSEEGCAMCGS